MSRRKTKSPARRSRAARTGTRRQRKSGRQAARRGGFLRRLVVPVVILSALAGTLWVAWQGYTVHRQFEGRRWSLPARVYASPFELYAGLAIDIDEFIARLRQLGYRPADGRTVREATWWRQGDSVRLMIRPFTFWDGVRAARVVQVDFAGRSIRRLRGADGTDLGALRLDPLEIGSIFPVHGEDRLVLSPAEVPGDLRSALIAVEDRKFASHHGIDPRAIARATWVNLRAGEIRQGGSTITQQLVKNYFLDNRRTFGRKLNEAVMAVWVDALYDKADILNAYVNEIYLGQDGHRAVHGFGLASRFYFGRPLTELDLSELALLVAVVRGPSWYNPWRHPERAHARRDRVLDAMAAQGVVSAARVRAAQARPLGVVAVDARTGYYPAYLDLVRRQLATDYRPEDLDSAGLRVFTALEVEAQHSAQGALSQGIGALERARPELASLEGAIVVTRPQTGEVLAVVGGRRAAFDGYNRALHATRPIGSLVKPAVYLAALESGRFHLGSQVEDAPIEIPLEDGSIWRPRNFTGAGNGRVTVLRALSESLNLATVRVGTDVGVDAVIATLERLGVERPLEAFPSLLLGAVELTPVEVAQIYGSLAGGGFRTRLRAVREVVDAQASPLDRYGIDTRPIAAESAVQQVNRALVVAMERGTGRAAADRLPAGLRVAGKTGTSNEFRDSWFAGFTGDNLAVVWLGYDDARPGGLSGARGAMTVWAELMREIAREGYRPRLASGLAEVWIDYGSGELVVAGCGDPVLVPVPEDTRLPVRPGCGPGPRNVAERALDWLKRLRD